MPRDLVLGNGSLLVCMDSRLSIRDLYWPYVGLYNHVSGRAIRFGVWVDGQFAWIDDRWERDLRYRLDCLVTECRLLNERLHLELTVSDAVDGASDVFVRRVVLRDMAGRARHVRLFLAADTVLCETDIGDTAYFDPFAGAVIHYKRDTYLLFGGAGSDGTGVSDFACGMKGLPDKEGTWRDCEDGDLSGNPIAQGTVDSAISVRAEVPAGGTSDPACFWIVVGPTREAVLTTQGRLRARTVAGLLDDVEARDRVRLAVWSDTTLAPLPRRVRALFRRSLLLIDTQTDRRGAILAANDTDIMRTNRAHYSYMWPRDGALVAHALDTAGWTDLSRRFFTFCRTLLPPERTAFMQKYGPDGSVGSSWHSWIAPNGEPEIPLQEDETALVVWALARHYARHGGADFVRPLYEAMARPCADFVLQYRDPATHLPLPSWDLWEERRGVHTFTVCTVIAALRAAAELAAAFGEANRAAEYAEGAQQTLAALTTHLWSAGDGRFARRLEVFADGTTALDRTLDASLHALHLFDILPTDDPKLQATMKQVNERLWVKAGIGGLARYEGDYYARVSHDIGNVPGNPWIICTLWKARWDIANARTTADLEAAADLLEWAEVCSLPSGVLPEQIHPYNFTPTTVAPLTWSHSEFVETACQWLEKHRTLTAG
jgi:GH15 family glucan-1,4-alpha-glucosidase